MRLKRSAGIFLHPTSLPSPYGIGDFGQEAYNFVDMLAHFKQKMWQICPMGPTGYGFSPYLSLSSFAGNSIMLSPQIFIDNGLLKQSECQEYPKLSENKIEFSKVVVEKGKLYKIAYSRFQKDDAFEAFCEQESEWLTDYVLFMVIRKKFKNRSWCEWPQKIKNRFEESLLDIMDECADDIGYNLFIQYQFSLQWGNLKKYANSKGISIFGDVPYYTAYDSADVWAQPEIFRLNKNSDPKIVGGVPPDYFSADGQLWGNPVYNWNRMKKNKFLWWKQRIQKAFDIADWVRLDHFRGFEAYWAVPFGHKTAINGKWLKGPGISLFKALGPMNLIAEDLGVITPQVDDLRLKAGLPGMKVLQFAFDGNADNPYLPYNTETNYVVYTGTHDNNTSIGWFNELSEDIKLRVCKYLGCNQQNFIDSFLRIAYASNASLCIVPFQDVLHLDSSHRMNTPGTGEGNWDWRFTWDMVHENKLNLISDFTQIYGR